MRGRKKERKKGGMTCECSEGCTCPCPLRSALFTRNTRELRNWLEQYAGPSFDHIPYLNIRIATSSPECVEIIIEDGRYDIERHATDLLFYSACVPYSPVMLRYFLGRLCNIPAYDSNEFLMIFRNLLENLPKRLQALEILIPRLKSYYIREIALFYPMVAGICEHELQRREERKQAGLKRFVEDVVRPFKERFYAPDGPFHNRLKERYAPDSEFWDTTL